MVTFVEKYVFPATLHPEADGRYSICFPDLSGCVTQGENISDAISAARDALGGWIYTALKHDDEIPTPSIAIQVDTEAGEIATLIDLDYSAYLRRHNQAAVKKTLSIPGWLNELAEAEGICFSKVLQEALCDRLQIK